MSSFRSVDAVQRVQYAAMHLFSGEAENDILNHFVDRHDTPTILWHAVIPSSKECSTLGLGTHA